VLPEPQSLEQARRRRDIGRHKRFRSLRWPDWQLYLRAIRLGTPSRSFVRSLVAQPMLQPTVLPEPQWFEAVLPHRDS
jgi:hypothetical protein